MAEPVPVATITVAMGQVPVFLDAVGTLEAERSVQLAPESPGRISGIRFRAGQCVQQGELVVQLYDAPERADREAAVAKVNLMRVQLARAEGLVPAGAASRAELDQRRAELEQAEASVKQIDARIAQKAVVAPFSGALGIRRVNLGQYVNPGDPIATLTSLDPLLVNFTVPQAELSRLSVGGAVTLTSDAWPGTRVSARISVIEPLVDVDTRNAQIQAVADNPDGTLRPGMYAAVRAVLPPESAIAVPATAIQATASGDVAFAVRDLDERGVGTIDVVAVRTGRRYEDRVVIAAGLASGDVIVVFGQNRVQDGMRVKVRPESDVEAGRDG